MKANELRIGNWVEQPNDGVTRVTAILNDLQIKTETGYIDKYCRPIPLTEEWLLKFGFTYDEVFGWSFSDEKIYFILNYYQPNNRVVLETDEESVITVPQDISYVHQLQNLYFALTGQELELKERQDA